MTWCQACGEFVYSFHKCPPQWKVWTEDEDPGADFEGACTVHADDAEAAAEKYAEMECSSNPDYYASYADDGPRVVFVRLVGGDETTTFCVLGEPIVEFHAREVGQK